MRLTREALIKVARDAAEQRTRVSRRIICIYLTGSVLSADPLLGGTTDIDLIFVHDSDPAQPREVVRVTDEVHLDISHYPQSTFHHPRHLRTDPWLGPFIYAKPLVLHDTQHWFDFLQAATGAQFYQPDYTLQRARALAQSARQEWMTLAEIQSAAAQPQRVRTYLRALEDAGNAIASLSGAPLTERRFFVLFPQRAQAIQRPEISARLVAMLSGSGVQLDSLWEGWVQSWKEGLEAAGQQDNPPPEVQGARRLYYERAAAALWQEHPIAALWIMLKSWTAAALLFASDSPQIEAWRRACQALQLDEDHFPNRVMELDQFLDTVEETLDVWGQRYGIPNII